MYSMYSMYRYICMYVMYCDVTQRIVVQCNVMQCYCTVMWHSAMCVDNCRYSVQIMWLAYQCKWYSMICVFKWDVILHGLSKKSNVFMHISRYKYIFEGAAIPCFDVFWVIMVVICNCSYPPVLKRGLLENPHLVWWCSHQDLHVWLPEGIYIYACVRILVFPSGISYWYDLWYIYSWIHKIQHYLVSPWGPPKSTAMSHTFPWRWEHTDSWYS